MQDETMHVITIGWVAEERKFYAHYESPCDGQECASGPFDRIEDAIADVARATVHMATHEARH